VIGLVGGSTLIIASLITAMFSTVAGIGGGTMLIGFIILMVDFALVLPVYGAIQMVSAGSRVWLFRKDVDWSMFVTFGIAFVPGAIIGGLLWYYFVNTEEAQPYIKMIIAAYLLMYLKFSSYRVAPGNQTRLLLIAGGLCGFAALTVGAVGAVIAPFVDALELKKERAIAAIGVMSMFSNIIKLPLLFVIADRVDWTLALIIGGMCVATFCGVYAGRGAQKYVSEAQFRRLFRIVLTVLGVKLLFWDGLRVVLM
jgi:uncharacterized protein